MADPKYSFAQKVRFIEAYMKEEGGNRILNASKMAKWCNEKYDLQPPLIYLDFRRPDDIKNYMDEINKRIKDSIFLPDGTNEVMPEKLIDIDHFLDLAVDAVGALVEHHAELDFGMTGSFLVHFPNLLGVNTGGLFHHDVDAPLHALHSITGMVIVGDSHDAAVDETAVQHGNGIVEVSNIFG
mgnify:CR=1 FL=1